MSNETKDILVFRNNQQIGPFCEAQIHESLTQGLLSPADIAWRPGLAEWKPLGILLNLPNFVPPPPIIPTNQQSAIAPSNADQKSKVTYILLGIFLGGLGIHNFYAGYTKKGTIQLLLTLLLCWTIVVPIGVWILAVIEAVSTTVDANGVPFSN